MHKDHKILIYTTTRVLTLIFLANAYAESPMDEDTMVYHSSSASQFQVDESAGKGTARVANLQKDLDFIDPKKSVQKSSMVETVDEETLPFTPRAQALETAEVLEEISAKTTVVRTVAGFSLEDVKETADLATLSYTGTFEGEVGRAKILKLKSEGWNIVEFSTQAERSGIVLVRGGEAIISYHGSESLRNFATDAYATMTEIEWASGYAHTGFLQGFEKTWEQVYNALNTHATKQGVSIRDMKVKVTGHSLGAALATLAAYRLAAVSEVKPEVINFASPRVFDRNAANNYETELKIRTLRVVHKDSTTGVDPVALVGPGILGFKHIGTLFEIEKGGSIPHVMGGYHGALGSLNDDQFEATKTSGNGFFGWLNKWLYPVESDRHIAKGIVRMSHIAPEKWSEVQGMETEERQAFITMRQASISLARAIAANKSPEILGELTQHMLSAQSYYDVVRDQHLDITPGVRKARQEVDSKKKALNEVLDKVERRQEELIHAVDYAEENFTSKKAQKEIEEKQQKLAKQKMKVEKAEEKLNTAKIRLAEKRSKAAHKKFGDR